MSPEMNLDELLALDAFGTAERVTGKSYRDDFYTSLLAVQLQTVNDDLKRSALQAAGDTTSGGSFEELERVTTTLGFERVLDVTFLGRRGEEVFRVYAHPEGLLGSAESWGGVDAGHVSSFSVDFNWTGPEALRPQRVSSWPLGEDTYAVHAVVTEGLAHRVARWRQDGAFVTPWSGRGWPLRLTHSGEAQQDAEGLTMLRLRVLPPWVRSFARVMT